MTTQLHSFVLHTRRMWTPGGYPGAYFQTMKHCLSSIILSGILFSWAQSEEEGVTELGMMEFLFCMLYLRLTRLLYLLPVGWICKLALVEKYS